MHVSVKRTLIASSVALTSLLAIAPAEAGRAYYCSCQGQVQKRVAGTYACQAYRLNVEKRPGASRSKTCLDGEWEKFKTYACGQDKCSPSTSTAFDAQRAGGGKK